MIFNTHFPDIEPVDENEDRLDHTHTDTPRNTIGPIRLLEQTVTKAVELEADPYAEPSARRRADVAVDRYVRPMDRFNRYEQVWYTIWFDHAFNFESELLTELNMSIYPDTWTDVTGRPFKVILETLAANRITGDITYTHENGLGVRSDAPSSDDSNRPKPDALEEDPFDPPETSGLVAELTGDAMDRMEEHNQSFQEAFQAAYENSDVPRTPSSPVGIASVLDSLEYIYSADGTESIEGEQVEKSAQTGWGNAVDSLLYHALEQVGGIHVPEVKSFEWE